MELVLTEEKQLTTTWMKHFCREAQEEGEVPRQLVAEKDPRHVDTDPPVQGAEWRSPRCSSEHTKNGCGCSV